MVHRPAVQQRPAGPGRTALASLALAVALAVAAGTGKGKPFKLT